MKTHLFTGAVLAFIATTVLAAAGQDKPMATAKTMVGCIEKSESGSLTLTHAMAAEDMKESNASKDTMAKNSMTKDALAKDTMMSPMELSSKKVDLSKHVGHKVSLKGVAGDTMNGMATFRVDSLKMLAASCS